MPTRVTSKNRKESVIQKVLMKKLTIDLGDGGIDRSIVKAAKKMITPRIDIASLTELSQCNIDMPKSVWRC